VIKYSSILLCGKRIAHGYQKEEGAYNNKLTRKTEPKKRQVKCMSSLTAK
jgi:hypothetical protein